MDTLDIVFLGILCCIIGAGYLFRQHKAARVFVVAILFCVSFGSVLSIATFGPRSAIKQHEREVGLSSKEFVEGVSSASKVAGLCYPYVALSIIGLALMAMLGEPKGRKNA